MTENIAENFIATLVTDPKNESVIYVSKDNGEKYPLDISQFSNKESLAGKQVHVTRDTVRNKITMVYKEGILYQTPPGDEARDQLKTIPGFMQYKCFANEKGDIIYIRISNLDDPEREGSRMGINYYYNLNKNIEEFQNWKNFEEILYTLKALYRSLFYPKNNNGINVEKIFRENLDNYSIDKINEMSEYLTSLLNGKIDSNESEIDHTDTRVPVKIKVKDAFDEYMKHIDEDDGSDGTISRILMKINEDFSKTTDNKSQFDQKLLRFYMYVKKLHTVYSKLKPEYEAVRKNRKLLK